MKGASSPALTAVHVAPPLVLLKSPPVRVPAYIALVGTACTLSVFTSGAVSPPLTGVQLAAASTLLNTPPPLVPAYTVDEFRGSAISASMTRFVSPVFIAVQVFPSSVDLKTPPTVPAYTVAGDWGSTASVNGKPVKPARRLQCRPPSVLLNTRGVDVNTRAIAYRVVGVRGATASDMTVCDSI